MRPLQIPVCSATLQTWVQFELAATIDQLIDLPHGAQKSLEGIALAVVRGQWPEFTSFAPMPQRLPVSSCFLLCVPMLRTCKMFAPRRLSLTSCMAGLLPFASLADLATLFSTNPMTLATNSSMPLSSFDSLCCEFAFGFEPMPFTLFDRYSGRAVPVQVVFALGKVPPTSMLLPRKLALPPCECSLRTLSLVC